MAAKKKYAIMPPVCGKEREWPRQFSPTRPLCCSMSPAPTWIRKGSPSTGNWSGIIAGAEWSLSAPMTSRNMIFVRRSSRSEIINEWLALTRDQQVQIRILQIKSLAEMEIGQGPLEQVNTAAQVYLMPYQVFKSPFFPRFQQQGHQYITDSMPHRPGKPGRDIRHPLLNNPVFPEDTMPMRPPLR